MVAVFGGIVSSGLIVLGSVLVALIQRNSKASETSLEHHSKATGESLSRLFGEVKGLRSDMKTEISEVRVEVGVLRSIVIEHIGKHDEHVRVIHR